MLQGRISCDNSCYDESTILANTAVIGGLAYVYAQMIPLSVKFFADTISSIQQVAGIASLVALTHCS
ncbi:MAG: hypothetical protein MRQ13_03615 [Candidatus Midichloria sp.]|nr:hypothetical protein [Candidatus Midichloria sp.]